MPSHNLRPQTARRRPNSLFMQFVDYVRPHLLTRDPALSDHPDVLATRIKKLWSMFGLIDDNPKLLEKELASASWVRDVWDPLIRDETVPFLQWGAGPRKNRKEDGKHAGSAFSPLSARRLGTKTGPGMQRPKTAGDMVGANPTLDNSPLRRTTKAACRPFSAADLSAEASNDGPLISAPAIATDLNELPPQHIFLASGNTANGTDAQQMTADSIENLNAAVSSLSKEEMEEIHALFRLCDSSGSGAIDQHELHSFMNESTAHQWPEDEVNKIFFDYDFDKDDLLSLEEFEYMMAVSYQSRRKSGTKDAAAGLPPLSIELCAQSLINSLIKTS